MVQRSRMVDSGEFIEVANGGVVYVLAGGAADGVEQVSAIIDRQAAAYKDAASAKIIVPWSATLAQAATLTLGFDVDDGEDSGLSDAAQFSAGVAAAVVGTGDTGGSTETGLLEINVNLLGAKRYLRVQWTATLSAGSVDHAEVGALAVFGGKRLVG